MPKIVAHTLVKNEARWIWFALMSVVDYVDEVMVWDTGSDDSTPEIIKSVDSPKLKFKEIGPVDALGHTAARKSMLDETDSDWILILDGDEIWYKDSFSSCLSAIKPNLSAIVSPFINLVGDIYHYQSPQHSHYQIGSHQGPYNIRFINRKIPGLHIGNPHGRQEYRNADEVALQNLPPENYLLVDKPYLHTTHLPRSISRQSDSLTLKRGFKFKYELGYRFPKDFVYPEVFYLPGPDIVPCPWTHRGIEYVAKSLIYEPARIVKNQMGRSRREGY